ncbi:MAG TPA: hypothetical protein VFH47_03230, partial [Candidatus Thermoplasmatota archaeon]|nr:hypothetical protein [Candidatus Thermoplasmatota archaeon]
MAETHATDGAMGELHRLAGTDLYLGIGIVALPLLASLLVFLVGKRMWRGGAPIVLAALVGSLLLSLRFFVRMVGGGEPVVWDTPWFTIGEFPFTVGLLFDNLSIWLATIVSLLALLIVTFSTHYM